MSIYTDHTQSKQQVSMPQHCHIMIW